MPAVMNAANEVAVEKFLAGKIGLWDIADSVGEALARHKRIDKPTLEEIIEVDKSVREEMR